MDWHNQVHGVVLMSKLISNLSLRERFIRIYRFNRIDVEVLSVVAQQLLTIKTAKDAHAVRFAFDGREIKMNSTCGFFVTMSFDRTFRNNRVSFICFLLGIQHIQVDSNYLIILNQCFGQ